MTRDDFDDENEEDVNADDDTIPCPYCGKPIYDDAVRCPACEQYLSDEERTSTMQPKWVVVTAMILLTIFLFAYLR